MSQSLATGFVPSGPGWEHQTLDGAWREANGVWGGGGWEQG